MEESLEVHEEDKVHSENGKKRTLKTPSQVEALEKLYLEHTYPSETLKSMLANEIGLSEKQVSGWFCHRRLKDKNMLKDDARVIGRQDFSSGIIQDRGSALKQDSCSSTKPGEHKHFDPREVESRRFSGQNSPNEGLAYINRTQYMHASNYNIMDNTSSGSTPASQERMSPQSKDPYEMERLMYLSRSSNHPVMNIKDLKPRGHVMGSEYFNSQDEIENAAMLAVKRQLGRHYREDGPPLGVKFESVPPTAFDVPVEDAIEGPHYLGDSTVPKSVGVLKVHKEPSFDKGRSKFKRGMLSHNSYPEGGLRRISMEPDHRNDCSSYQLGKPSLTNCRTYDPNQYSSVDNFDDDPAGTVGIFNKSKKRGTRPMPGVEGMKSKSVENHFTRPYDNRVITNGSSYPRQHNRDDSSLCMLQKEEHLTSPMTLQYDECLGTEHIRMEKLEEESLYKERRRCKEPANSARIKRQLNNKLRRGKNRQNYENLPLDYASKTPSPNALLPWGDKMKGYAGEMPTSFSDDETALTSSSMD